MYIMPGKKSITTAKKNYTCRLDEFSFDFGFVLAILLRFIADLRRF